MLSSLLFVVAIACSSAAQPSSAGGSAGAGTGGVSGIGGSGSGGADGGADAPADTGSDASTDCKKVWVAPGCGDQAPAAMCDDGRGGACGGSVCDCHNVVHQTACDRSDVPFNYRFTSVPAPAPDASCNTNPDAGADH